ncbi:hypothetical protein J1N35_010941 [Gossypium stocksii]|uniref:Uncharacterized protein n=1 Tax=Gossypium stocksii TaxID=47602 RepID=A0A9D4ACS2_9ROSI|nr:hypothetical protein J1N35_010941 [Gossypium stocksii]
METCVGRGKNASNLRDMMSALRGNVAKLEGSIGDVRETLEVVEGHINELDLMKVQLRDMW